jgi:hypothetical protein
MNEELENVLNSNTPQNQNGETAEIESESSVVGVIFTVLAWLNFIVGLMLMIVEANESYYDSYAPAFALLGSSLFLFAVASCLKFLAKISSRMGRIMKALEK